MKYFNFQIIFLKINFEFHLIFFHLINFQFFIIFQNFLLFPELIIYNKNLVYLNFNNSHLVLINKLKNPKNYLNFIVYENFIFDFL